MNELSRSSDEDTILKIPIYIKNRNFHSSNILILSNLNSVILNCWTSLWILQNTFKLLVRRDKWLCLQAMLFLFTISAWLNSPIKIPLSLNIVKNSVLDNRKMLYYNVCMRVSGQNGNSICSNSMHLLMTWC